MATWPTSTELQDHLDIPGNAADAGLVDKAIAGSIAEIAERTRFGADDTEIPADVHLAALFNAAKLYNRRNTPDGIAGDSEFGVVRANRFDPDVERLIRPYLTIPIAIV